MVCKISGGFLIRASTKVTATYFAARMAEYATGGSAGNLAGLVSAAAQGW